MQELFPSLGVDPGERAYGAECRLYIPGKGINWETINATLFDEFVVAHTLGWWAKAIILRNSVLLWSLSILFELMELTFQHMLPNFNECWWDSWILDVLVCNNIGIITGLWTVRYFGSKIYNWRGISEQPTYADKAKRSLMQFLPYSCDKFEWRIFSTPARFIECLVPVLIFLLFELHAFFLKFVLWIPPLNPLNTIRLLILLGMGLPATRQYYDFIECENLSLNKIGAFAWLGLALAIVETLVAIKFGHGMFPKVWPATTIAVWSIVFVLFTVTFYRLVHQVLCCGQAPSQAGSSARKAERQLIHGHLDRLLLCYFVISCCICVFADIAMTDKPGFRLRFVDFFAAH